MEDRPNKRGRMQHPRKQQYVMRNDEWTNDFQGMANKALHYWNRTYVRSGVVTYGLSSEVLFYFLYPPT